AHPPPAPDTARYADTVTGLVAVGEAVVLRFRDLRRDGATGVELPPEQVTVVAPQLLGILSGDLDVHTRLSHVDSLLPVVRPLTTAFRWWVPGAAGRQAAELVPATFAGTGRAGTGVTSGVRGAWRSTR